MNSIRLLCCALLTGSALATRAASAVSVEATDDYASEQSVYGFVNDGRFTLFRTGDPTAALTVYFTVGGTATPFEDYSALPNAVAFHPGAATITLSVHAHYARGEEPTESVVLTLLHHPSYALGEPDHATVNIWQNDFNDPSLPTVMVFAQSGGTEYIFPGGFVDTVVFSVYRSGPTNLPLTLDYTLGGTAVPGVDYIGHSFSLTIPAGRSSRYIEFSPVEDSFPEGPETINLTLLPSNRYTLGASVRAESSIYDFDSQVPPAINSGWLALSAGRLGFKVNGPASQNFRILTSANLSDWTPALTNSIPGGSEFIEPASGAGAQLRFFRAVPE